MLLMNILWCLTYRTMGRYGNEQEPEYEKGRWRASQITLILGEHGRRSYPCKINLRRGVTFRVNLEFLCWLEQGGWDSQGGEGVVSIGRGCGSKLGISGRLERHS